MVAFTLSQFHELLSHPQFASKKQQDTASGDDFAACKSAQFRSRRPSCTTGFPMVTIVGLLIAATFAGQIGGPTPRDRRPDSFATGPKFQTELNQATSGTWANVELRSLLNTLGAQRRIAILLDRRIDPTAQLPVEIVDQPFRDALQGIAHQVSAELCVPGNVVYVGPPAAVKNLRTLVELRTSELKSKATGIPESRRTELSRPQSFEWPDLQTPSDIVRQISDQYHLAIRNPDLIPHDLWAAGNLPAVTSSEALSIILIQFDLTFAWVDSGQAIELSSIRERPTIERRHRSKGRTAADVARLIAEHFPDLKTTPEGADIAVTGTVEDHEAIAALLNPVPTKKPSPTPPAAPLRQRKFTLTFKRVPVRTVMEELKKSKIVFVYDEAALTTAGINLDQTVNMELNNATADEFFRSLFDPLMLAFEIDNVTVKLTPKK